MPDPARLTLDLDLTIYTAQDTKQQLCGALDSGTDVELDLSRVGEMDTAGFQLLVMAKQEAQRLGHQLRVVAHSQAVREIIEFYNMAAFFGDPVVIPAAERN
jgi:anti-sigma B factor antagonist